MSANILDSVYMNIALREAKIAYIKGEVPVGAVIVDQSGTQILSKAHNASVKMQSPLYHAEIIAIDEAIKKLEGRNLNGCSLFVTLEPCIMCYGAIEHANISNLYVGALSKEGFSSRLNAHKNSNMNIYEGFHASCSQKLIQSFFANQRR